MLLSVSNLIDDFVTLTNGSAAPAIYRRWIAISTVAACLGRHVWTYLNSDDPPVRPNLYTLLVGPPASGKSIQMPTMRDILHDLDMFTGDDDTTAASLICCMAALSEVNQGDQNNTNTMLKNEDKKPSYTEDTIVLNEFSTFLKANDDIMVAFLANIWDCDRQYSKSTKTQGSDLIKAPCLNLIAGVTPDTLGVLFGGSTLGQGLPSRCIMIYSNVKIRGGRDYGRGINGPKHKALSLVPQLSPLLSQHGMYEWTKRAGELNDRLAEKDYEPLPKDPLLEHYIGRRELMITKLAMVSAAATHQSMQIKESDVNRAYRWLIEAEALMPKALMNAGGNKERAIEEAAVDFVRDKGSCAESVLRQWLAQHIETYRRDGIIDDLLAQNRLVRVSGHRPGRVLEAA